MSGNAENSDGMAAALKAKRKLNLMLLFARGYKDVNWIPLGMTADEYIEYRRISEIQIPHQEFAKEIKMACERLNITDFKFQALALFRMQVASEDIIVETIQAKDKALKQHGKDILLAKRIGGLNI